MIENERDFEKVVAGLHIDAKPDPAHKQRLRRQMLQTFADAARPARMTAKRPRPQRIPLLRRSLAKLAVAAVVVVAVGIGLWKAFGPGRGPATAEQICQATRKMPWLHAVATHYDKGDVHNEEHWYDFASEKAYVLRADGTVLGWDSGADKKQFMYSPRVKRLAITELSPDGVFGAASAYTIVDAFAVFAAQDDVTVRQWDDRYEGETVRAYEIERPARGGRAATALRIKMMADPETNRIVAADVEHCDPSGVALAREEWVMSYPPSGPRSVYDLGVPRSIRVLDMRMGYIGTPGDSPTPVPTPGEPARDRLTPLKIDLPKPTFRGTPENNRVPNLQKPRRGPRPPFLVPPGTTNVARGKPVSASDRDPVVGRLDMITDGDKEAADGSFVELGPFLQHVTIDLRGRYEIYAIVVWHYHQQPRVYFDVAVQVSNDSRFRRGVTTVFNNDIDDSAGLGKGDDLHYTETYEGKLIHTRGIQARYVRLYSNGNTSDNQNHYIEVEVYGRPAR